MLYDDLIDYCVTAEEDPENGSSVTEMFRSILAGYFFKDETADSKSFTFFLEKFEFPDFLKKYSSIYDVDIDELRNYVDNETINGSLCGKIFLSTAYLKAFYPHQPPSFNQLSPDVRAEVLNKIKEMNRAIIAAFEKLKADFEADKNRKVLTVVAFIIKNIHRATEFPLKRLEKKAQDVIREIFPSSDTNYSANGRQNGELGDEGRVRDLIKAFFAIRKFQDIAELNALYRKELEHYKKRTLRALR